MQIKEIVLYGLDGEIRRITFQPGRVNIISGASKTGKSSLAAIVEYCLTTGDINVPVGVIRDHVAWYGVLLQFPDTQCFVARRDPGPRVKSSGDVYFDFAAEVNIPALSELRQVTNSDGLVQTLSAKLGIAPNVHEPGDRHTRHPLEANIKHALLLSIQRQSEVANQNILFHRQDEPFMPQAIKDTLPYFLGAVSDDRLSKRDELRRLRQELRPLERQAKEEEDLRRGAAPRAQTLLAEAINVGLAVQSPAPASFEDALTRLRNVQERLEVPASELRATGDGLTQLRTERSALLTQLSQAKQDIAAARTFLQDQGGFAFEATAQQARLQSVGLLPEGDGEIVDCPLCAQRLPAPLPSAASLNQAVIDLGSQLAHVATTKPRLTEYIDGKEQEVSTLQGKLRGNQRATSALVAQDRESAARRALEESQAYVRGRISVYLESVTAPPAANAEFQENIETIRKRIAQIEDELRDDSVREILYSALNVIGKDMSRWAERLQHEYARYPLRIDLGQLTVVADTEDGPVPMQRMGSAENWVGCHIIALLALHRWFVMKGRPVPHFLFLDQPTQVYYPPERDADGSVDVLDDEDRIAVRRLFELIFEVAADLAPGLQVIITDHAELRDDAFQEALVERWRKGEPHEKLIPPNWRSRRGLA